MLFRVDDRIKLLEPRRLFFVKGYRPLPNYEDVGVDQVGFLTGRGKDPRGFPCWTAVFNGTTGGDLMVYDGTFRLASLLDAIAREVHEAEQADLAHAAALYNSDSIFAVGETSIQARAPHDKGFSGR